MNPPDEISVFDQLDSRFPDIPAKLCHEMIDIHDLNMENMHERRYDAAKISIERW